MAQRGRIKRELGFLCSQSIPPASEGMRSLLFAAACVAASALGSVLGGTTSIKSFLDSEGIEYVVPGEPGYQNASRAFNLRLHFEPVAVAYPTSTDDVSVLVEAAAILGLAGESCDPVARAFH